MPDIRHSSTAKRAPTTIEVFTDQGHPKESVVCVEDQMVENSLSRILTEVLLFRQLIHFMPYIDADCRRNKLGVQFEA